MNKNKKKPEVKEFRLEIKESPTAEGKFTGYAAVFGNVDSGGDVIEPGAFLRTIKNRGDKPWPILFSHLWKEPAIGKATLSEDAYGLLVNPGELFVDIPKAKDVLTGMIGGVVGSMSFMYDVLQWEFKNIGGQSVRVLKELRLYEVSLLNTGYGMNELAGVTGLKGTRLEETESDARIAEIEETLEQLKNATPDGEFKQQIKAMQDQIAALQSQVQGLVEAKAAHTPESDELDAQIEQVLKEIQKGQEELERMAANPR